MANNEKNGPNTISFVPDKEMLGYLNDIVQAGGYGNTPTSVVQRLAWESIRKLDKEGWIDRRKGENGD